MPLIKTTSGLSAVAPSAEQKAADSAPKAEAPKPVYTGGRKAASDAMTKDEWAAKDARISLQGVLQALLVSVTFGQYLTGTTADEHLSLVEQFALRLAKFVRENA